MKKSAPASTGAQGAHLRSPPRGFGNMDKRGVDSLLGAAHVALFGVSMAWWKRSHNTHHVVCNSVENDPDIQHLPVLAVSPAIFEGFASTYHAKAFAPLVLDPIAHFIVSYQHLLYYVFMFFGRYNLYVQSFALLLDFKERVELRFVDSGVLFECDGSYVVSAHDPY